MIKQIDEIITAHGVLARLSESLKAESEVSEKIGQLAEVKRDEPYGNDQNSHFPRQADKKSHS